MIADSAGDPWLSVISVVRNDPEGFQSTLASLQGQDLAGVEFVVVDSSDNPAEIPALLEFYPEASVNYYWVEPRGIYAAMNTGIDLAKGEYVFFANAGDTFFSDSVLASMKNLLIGADLVWVVGRVRIIETDGNEVTTSRLNFEAERDRLFARGIFPPHQATVVRTWELKSLGGFSEQFAIAADYHAALKLAKISTPVVVDNVFMTFREGGVSTQQWRESFREFHQARLDVFAPSGMARLVELFDTYRHYATVWLHRNVMSGFTRRREDRV